MTGASVASAHGSTAHAQQAVHNGEPILLRNPIMRGGVLAFASETIDADRINFLLHQARSVICTGIPGEKFRSLAHSLRQPITSPFLTVDAVRGTSTGVSAADRARTVTALADCVASGDEFAVPGHVSCVAVASGGCIERVGVTEALSDLARLAGLSGAVVYASVLDDAGEMATELSLDAIAATGIASCSVADVIRLRRQLEGWGSAELSDGVVTTIRLASYVGKQLTVLVRGTGRLQQALPIGVHDFCAAGHVLAGTDCACGQLLARDLDALADCESGAIAVLANHQSSFDSCPRGVPATVPDRCGVAATVAAVVAGAAPRPFPRSGDNCHEPR
jgi:3,4-dihydroxy 2-butanone 4-phosphate synthase/GTP cyclohydrolase II